MVKESPKILLFEENPAYSNLLKAYLQTFGYKVVVAENVIDGLHAFNSNSFELCIVNIFMKSSATLALKIRKKSTNIPIIFITARLITGSNINGFINGHDEYITKPFSNEELHLKVRTILKRLSKADATIDLPGNTNVVVSLGKFKFDYDKSVLIFEGEKYHLTRKERELLKLLCDNQGSVVKRDFIMKTIWGEEDYFIGRSMDVFITKIRKKLKLDSSIRIDNIHGVGFKITVR